MERNGAFWTTGTKRVYVKKRTKRREERKGEGLTGHPIARGSPGIRARTTLVRLVWNFCAELVFSLSLSHRAEEFYKIL